MESTNISKLRVSQYFSLPILVRELLSNIYKVVGFLIASIVIIAFFASLYPTIATGEIELEQGIFLMLPEEILNILELDFLLPYQNYATFMSLGLQFVVMLSCVFSCMVGAQCIVREKTLGTMEFLYSMPISRVGIAITKFLANIVIIIIYNLLVYFSFNIITSAMLDVKSYQGVIFNMFFLSLVGQLVFMAFGFFCSSIISDRTLASSIAFSSFLITYIFGLISTGLPEMVNSLGTSLSLDDIPSMSSLTGYKLLSPYHLADPLESIHKSFTMDPTHLAICWIFIVLFMVASCLIIQRKDISN